MKVMILGAANGQIPFIKICKKYGAKVIVVSPAGNYPGFQLADKCIYEDTRDKDKILNIAEELQIDAILTDQTDVSVPSVAYVGEKLGLKSIGYDLALKFTNKYLMREEAKKNNIAVPNFVKVTKNSKNAFLTKSLKYPLIVKPVDSSGSRGVIKVENPSGINDAIQESIQFSATEEVIVEEFIDGTEYLVDGIALNGKYRNLDLGIKQYFNIPNKYISKMCMFSSAALIDDNVEKLVLAENQKLVEAMGLPFGITHAEYIFSKRDQRVYLVEIAARGGGVFLSSHLTPKASGVNTNNIIIDYVLNDNVIDIDKLILEKKVAAWRCFELIPGIITDIHGLSQLREIHGVFKVCLDDLYIGKKIGILSSDTDKIGPILIAGRSREECFQTLKNIEGILEIKTECNGIKSGIRW